MTRRGAIPRGYDADSILEDLQLSDFAAEISIFHQILITSLSTSAVKRSNYTMSLMSSTALALTTLCPSVFGILVFEALQEILDRNIALTILRGYLLVEIALQAYFSGEALDEKVSGLWDFPGTHVALFGMVYFCLFHFVAPPVNYFLNSLELVLVN